MNTRIKELAGNALDKTVPYTWTKLDYDQIQELLACHAELIMKECLTVINDSKEYKTPQDGWSEWDAGWNPALEQAEENIKQHFGVEE